MKDVLTEILAWKRQEVEQQKQELPPRQLYARVEELMTDPSPRRSMRGALAKSRNGIIAEFKRKSPSKGWIRANASPIDIVPQYEAAGAAALSILTDAKYFGGSMDFIPAVRPLVAAPILRKDFVVDEYQLFQARMMGADAVLLIAAALPPAVCATLAGRAHELGLEVLLELHAPEELDHATEEMDMVGVNNRNLGTFHTDVENSFRLARCLPQGPLWVSESGISQPETLFQLREAGFQGFLIGETFMRESSPGESLRKFIETI